MISQKSSLGTFADGVEQVENESRRASLPQKAGASSEQLGGVEESIMRLSGQVSTLTRQQKYFRTRENRNFSTVHSTEGRIFNLNLMETGLMIAMAALQVFVVKMFFTGGRKGKNLLMMSCEGSADFMTCRICLKRCTRGRICTYSGQGRHTYDTACLT